MIRFQISDVVALDRRPCACGRTLPRLRAVHGRLEDVLRLPGARGEAVPVHPTQFSTMAGDPAVREFQVRQRGSRILLRLALHDGAPADAPERIARTVTERLRALGVDRPAVTAEVTDSIERTPAGKLRLVVPDPTADAVVRSRDGRDADRARPAQGARRRDDPRRRLGHGRAG